MSLSLPEIWEKTMNLLLQEPLYNPQINTWFRPLKPLSLEGNKLTIAAPNTFTKNHLMEDKNKYRTLLSRLFYEASGIKPEILFVLETDSTVTANVPTKKVDSHLNPKYTFDSFVVGHSNRFAHAASLAVAENPMEAHANPLFIYGGVGLGKTHLMHAIGHFMQRNDPTKKILYVTSEQFTNEFIASIQMGRNEEFRRKYRSVDLLLIDDIQFIADKESTMDEFFHTFNELHGQDRQIVMTSDQPPKDIKKLEQRLISRFAWGLVVDIQPPDLETRIAILKNKALIDGYEVPDEVFYYIAGNVKSNIRELEGALSRIIAYARFSQDPITQEMTEAVLKDVIDRKAPVKITTERIKEIVCHHYNISLEEMDSAKRPRYIAYPRQIAMYLTRMLTDLSLPKIGDEFGGRDHSTVVHAYDKIQKDMEEDDNFRLQIQKLTDEIKGQ
ncbi:MAG: chromosomal replication initiator protein DnaA [Tissierellia bacterium]|nr:chromosomal replication initiator protein DnaA [Tissierellia bacterium]